MPQKCSISFETLFLQMDIWSSKQGQDIMTYWAVRWSLTRKFPRSSKQRKFPSMQELASRRLVSSTLLSLSTFMEDIVCRSWTKRTGCRRLSCRQLLWTWKASLDVPTSARTSKWALRANNWEWRQQIHKIRTKHFGQEQWWGHQTTYLN